MLNPLADVFGRFGDGLTFLLKEVKNASMALLVFTLSIILLWLDFSSHLVHTEDAPFVLRLRIMFVIFNDDFTLSHNTILYRLYKIVKEV